MIAVNDAYCKYLFDNRYVQVNHPDGIMRTTNLSIAGKMLLSPAMAGVAKRKHASQSLVQCNSNGSRPIKAIEAVFDGFA
jgi:S-adenosylhomocysteine hydrolase